MLLDKTKKYELDSLELVQVKILKCHGMSRTSLTSTMA